MGMCSTHAGWALCPLMRYLLRPPMTSCRGHKLVSALYDQGCSARSGKVHQTKQAAECTPLSCDESSSRLLSQGKGAALLVSLPCLHRS